MNIYIEQAIMDLQALMNIQSPSQLKQLQRNARLTLELLRREFPEESAAIPKHHMGGVR